MKFRIWDKQNKSFVTNDCSLHCFSQWMIDMETGEPYDAVGVIDGDHENNRFRTLDEPENCYMDFKHKDNVSGFVKEPRYIVQQSTGLKNEGGEDIYEGDIVQFKYFVGDFAWEDMTKEEAVENGEMTGKVFIGTVCPKLLEPNNMELVVDGVIYFPLSYASGGKVLGNIFENKELIEV